MSSRVEVLDEVRSGCSASAIAALVEAVLTGEQRECLVGVALVSESTIAELNQRYRGKAGATDVLSFLDEDDWPDYGTAEEGEQDAGPGTFLGEIVICPAVVSRYAGEEGMSINRQMGWTIIHGTLHLLGYDHEIDQGQMRERERVLLAQLTERLADLTFASES